MKNAPPYIPFNHLNKLPNHYLWDDWDPYELIGEVDEKLVDKLSQLSYRAVVIFAIGCSEWVVWKFKEKLNDNIPYQYLEACWAYILTDKYEAPPELDDEDWKGEIRGVVNMALVTILNSIYSIEDECPEAEAAYADTVALYILDRDQHYVEWRDKILERLKSFYPRDDKNPMGFPIPREILNTDMEFNYEKSNEFITKFLKSIDIAHNSFINIYES